MMTTHLNIGVVHYALYNSVWPGMLAAGLLLLYPHCTMCYAMVSWQLVRCCRIPTISTAASHIKKLIGHLLEVVFWQSEANGKACHDVICHFSCLVHEHQHFLPA